MSKTIRFRFDDQQPHQQAALSATAALFDGLPRYVRDEITAGDVTGNLPPFFDLDEQFLLGNLQRIQEEAGLPVNMELDTSDGLMLDLKNGDAGRSHRFPLFTVEMETGTGKTYVYLRSIHELRQRYGFSKYIIVVPSVAIYEGVVKSFQVMRDHFRKLYGNETVNLIEYDGSQMSKIRNFATGQNVEILLITIQAFNSATNNLYKRTEKLPGEKFPYQYVQETSPVLILDESQNYWGENAQKALRTLAPLFALCYSATPVRKPNPIYRLTPLDAFKQNLVKKIQVVGVKDRENINYSSAQLSLSLERIQAYGLEAEIRAIVNERGLTKEKTIKLRKGDDLYDKTKHEAYKGIIVENVDAKSNVVVFNQFTVSMAGEGEENTSVRRREEFRVQIEETIKHHFDRQRKLRHLGIKVLSLFFIDRVANYTAEDGLIRQLFEQAYRRLQSGDDQYRNLPVEAVQSGYFAKKKDAKSGKEVYLDTSVEEQHKTQEERKLEKAAYELIMKSKERLLSFDEPVSFLFAHSALREGWDNPNVFQICTLNQAQSENRKRQEIGRGLRIAVNQDGERVAESSELAQGEEVNILTVVANESYEQYVDSLQKEYRESGDVAPPPPSQARKARIERNLHVFMRKDFRDFWSRLCRRADYEIRIDTEALVQTAVEKLNAASTRFPESQIVITRGAFVITSFKVELLSAVPNLAQIRISIEDTMGNQSVIARHFKRGDDLYKMTKDERLRGFKVVEIANEFGVWKVWFGDKGELTVGHPISWQTEQGYATGERSVQEAQTTYPVFNLIDRAAHELSITRPTVVRIFKGIHDDRKRHIFRNPEGFANVFIATLREILAEQVAERIEYRFAGKTEHYDLEEFFPPFKELPQKELEDGSAHSMYDRLQVDSQNEVEFVRQLRDDDAQGLVMTYFKFPNGFKVRIPKIIGNYNPDWGIIRPAGDDMTKILHLIRETKGSDKPEDLQFPNEWRKIRCAIKYFNAIGVDYRHVKGDMPGYWRPRE